MTAFRFCAGNLLLVAAMISLAQAGEQGYPLRPLRIVVPGAAGSGDILARLTAEGLTQVFGRQVVVEARPGANGIIAAEAVAKSAPDGYSVFQVNIAQAASVSLYRSLPFDLNRDFATVTQTVSSPHVIVVHPSVPAKSVPELLKLAKAKPGAINYSSLGLGSSTFLAAELFKSQAGINMVDVPYKGGGAALIALISGETSIYFSPLASAMPYMRGAMLRPLAVTTANRVPLVPDLPTVAEAGLPGYEFANWYGLLVPAKTPGDIVSTLRTATITALNRSEINKRIIELSYIIVCDRPDQFAAYIKAEIAKLTKLAADLQLKPN